MVFILALGAAFANALTSVFQRKGIELAPADTTLRFSLIRYALHRKIWLAGFGLMIISFLLQAVALHLGRLSEVQPILVTELVFLVVVLAAWFGFSIGRREWIGALCLTGGLAGFLYFADPVEGTLSPPLWEWLIAGGACFLWQQWLIRHRDRAGCFAAFQNNNYFGFAVFAGVLLEYSSR